MKHVPEPWKVEPAPTRKELKAGRDSHAVYISTDWPNPGALGRGGRSIAKMTGFGLLDAKWTAENRATAARIVACVNACAGIADPAAFIQSARENQPPPDEPTAPYLEKVNCSRGAPMGRPTHDGTRTFWNDGKEHTAPPDPDDDTPMHLRAVPLHQGYDPGGAYWGSPSNLFCAWNHARTYWTRAPNRDQAKANIRKDHPDAPEFKR